MNKSFTYKRQSNSNEQRGRKQTLQQFNDKKPFSTNQHNEQIRHHFPHYPSALWPTLMRNPAHYSYAAAAPAHHQQKAHRIDTDGEGQQRPIPHDDDDWNQISETQKFCMHLFFILCNA